MQPCKGSPHSEILSGFRGITVPVANTVTIIDPRAGDIAAIIASLPAGAAVFVLDPARDGLAQIAGLLAGMQGIEALNIVSHGSAGALLLGDSLVDGSGLADQATVLAEIGSHLAQGGDILLYGCDVASGADGTAFIDSLAALTGADVAASTDLTGAAALGGNWALEAHSGTIEAQSLVVAGFGGVLDVINGDGLANTLDGTVNDDTISGLGGNDTINGLGGNDSIDGGTGSDTMVGGIGDDIYFVDASADVVTEVSGEGTDTINASLSWSLSANIENLILTGTNATNGIGNTQDNTMFGNSAANILTGNAGNDFLDGQGGADTLVGGTGNDTYVLDISGDTATEALNEGIDTVRAAFSYVIGANLENLVLTGTDAIDGVGNAAGNIMVGNAANNVLTGNDGNDTLDGAGGTDTLIGGVGNDTYTVHSASDTIIEVATEGSDTVQADFTYTLADNFENLRLTGAAAINGTGNSVDNVLTGNDGVNTLTGLGGNDTYVINSSSDVVVEALDQGTDTVQIGLSYVLGANVENLVLTGTTAINGTGNAIANTLTGNDGANVLTGGDGDDIYIAGAGDTVVEAAAQGMDTVQASVSWVLSANVENLLLTGLDANNGTGNDIANTIDGNTAANVIDGGQGADTMAGHRGNDTYYADNIGDVAFEGFSEGTDTVFSSVSFTLGVNVENLELTGSADLSGTGNAGKNTLIGNSGDNVLDGGAGVDNVDGGEGSDLYMIAAVKDHLRGEFHDSGTTGTDELRISATSAGSVTLSKEESGIEHIVIGTGTGALADTSGTAALNIYASAVTNALTITGNSGGNRITGTEFDDIIDGGAGNDTMNGGAGDDTYYIDSSADKTSERANSGTDTVIASVTYKLGTYVDVLTLSGTANIDGTGNTIDNQINGNSGANLLDGGRGDDILSGGDGADTLFGNYGDDTLTGGLGADAFLFKNAPRAASGVDLILDFSHAEGDVIQLSKAQYRGLGTVLGGLTADQFHSGTEDAAQTVSERIIYNTATGALYYDADGTGRAAALQIAQIGDSVHPALDFSDFLIVA